MPLTRRAALAAPLLMAAGPLPQAARPIDRMSTPWWRDRHIEKLADIKRGTSFDLVLLGDSILHNLESYGPEPWRDYREVWAKYFAPRHTLNLGFKGDATSHLLWRIRNGELEGLAPKAAIILIGANNMGRLHWPAADSVMGVEAVVDETQRLLPRTQIILLAILPSDRSAWVDETTAAINRGLASRYAAGRVIWHDASKLFLRQGRVDHSQFYDPRLTPPEPALHPTPEGMAKLAENLAPLLDRAFK
jgi:lysophospholipase L1-like esterase